MAIGVFMIEMPEDEQARVTITVERIPQDESGQDMAAEPWRDGTFWFDGEGFVEDRTITARLVRSKTDVDGLASSIADGLAST